MKRVMTSDGVKIAVYDPNPCGEQTVRLIHGWPLSHEIFEYQLYPLLQRGYRVVTMDLRGFGSSGMPKEGYCYDRLAEDIYEVVKELGLYGFILGVFSMGGAAVLRYMRWFEDIALSASGFATVQTAVFQGNKDAVVPRDLTMYQHRSIPGSVLYQLPESGHGVMYDELERFNGYMPEFIEMPGSCCR